MEKKAFHILRDGESSWWYKGRADVIHRVLSLLKEPSSTRRILDVGAGFGGMCETLKRYGEVYAMEPDSSARLSVEKRGYAQVFSSLEEMERAGVQVDVMCAFDVIEHTPDDSMFVAELRRFLSPDGVLIATVPAYPLLWSDHDVMHHHFRRYGKKALNELFLNQGFSVTYVSYWNMLLLPVAVVGRMFGAGGESSLNPRGIINRIFHAVVSLENHLIPKVCLPFGLSLVIVATKTVDQQDLDGAYAHSSSGQVIEK